MRRRVSVVLSSVLMGSIALLAWRASAEEKPPAPPVPSVKPVTSEVRKTAAGERILIQRLRVKAPVAAAWKAYTTDAGWTAWASAQAKIDLRVGGKILTRYDKDGKLGDPGTNTLTIVNYVPNELLTLKADLAANWPEVMKKDADNLSNVILFRDAGDGITEISSYGIGYRDVAEYDQLLTFFTNANERLMLVLKRHLESTSAPK